MVERGHAFRVVIGEVITGPESMKPTPLIVEPPPDQLVFDEKSGELEGGLKVSGTLLFGGEGSALELKKN